MQRQQAICLAGLALLLCCVEALRDDEATSSSKESEGAFESRINKTIIVNDHEIKVIDNLKGEEEAEEQAPSTTSSPEITKTGSDLSDDSDSSHGILDVIKQQADLNTLAESKLLKTKTAIENLHRELLPLAGRSDYIAEKIKILTRYLNSVEEDKNATITGRRSKFSLLEYFVDMVEKLRRPDAKPEYKLDSILVKLALDMYHVVELQGEVKREVLDARSAWQDYTKEKLVEVSV